MKKKLILDTGGFVRFQGHEPTRNSSWTQILTSRVISVPFLRKKLLNLSDNLSMYLKQHLRRIATFNTKIDTK